MSTALPSPSQRVHNGTLFPPSLTCFLAHPVAATVFFQIPIPLPFTIPRPATKESYIPHLTHQKGLFCHPTKPIMHPLLQEIDSKNSAQRVRNNKMQINFTHAVYIVFYCTINNHSFLRTYRNLQKEMLKNFSFRNSYKGVLT